MRPAWAVRAQDTAIVPAADATDSIMSGRAEHSTRRRPCPTAATTKIRQPADGRLATETAAINRIRHRSSPKARDASTRADPHAPEAHRQAATGSLTDPATSSSPCPGRPGVSDRIDHRTLGSRLASSRNWRIRGLGHAPGRHLHRWDRATQRERGRRARPRSAATAPARPNRSSWFRCAQDDMS